MKTIKIVNLISTNLLSKKRTCTVRFDKRNKIACRVRTHFLRNGIFGSASTLTDPGEEKQHPIWIASFARSVVLLAPKGTKAFAPVLAPTCVRIKQDR